MDVPEGAPRIVLLVAEWAARMRPFDASVPPPIGSVLRSAWSVPWGTLQRVDPGLSRRISPRVRPGRPGLSSGASVYLDELPGMPGPGPCASVYAIGECVWHASRPWEFFPNASVSQW